MRPGCVLALEWCGEDLVCLSVCLPHLCLLTLQLSVVASFQAGFPYMVAPGAARLSSDLGIPAGRTSFAQLSGQSPEMEPLPLPGHLLYPE